jgi:hypothetical protein
MQPAGAARFTIGQVMVGIAVLASLLAVPRLVLSPDRIVMVCLVGLLTALVVLNVLAEMVFGMPCPSCSRWTLHRLARHPCYYRCSSCRGRFKRYGFGPWLDASGPEDAARFRKPTDAGTWKGFAAPKDLAGTTSGELLEKKRTLDLPEVVKRQSHQPGRRRHLEAATRKVRKALTQMREVKD